MGDQYTANAVYQSAAGLANEPTATLGTVVALSEAGRAEELVRLAFPDVADEKLPQTIKIVFSSLVRAGMVHAGAARWRVSWSGPDELVKADGEVLDDEGLGAQLADASTAAEAATCLGALEVDIDVVGASDVPQTANAGSVLGGISDMVSDGARYDVLILDTGLVLAEVPSDTAQRGSTRLDLLQRSSSTAGLVARHRFVPYASMDRAKVSGTVTVKATIAFEDGTTLRLKERTTSEYLAPKNEEVFKYQLTHL
jgi:hypothetical protein